jgi:AraC-like DNA-binding protein
MVNMINTYQAHAKKIKQQLLFFEPSHTQSNSTVTQQEQQIKLLQQIQRCLQQHYRNAEVKADDMVQNFPMSEKSLNRQLQAITVNSLTELLRDYRLNQAKAALKQGASIKATCFDCGFSSMSYFSRCFKQQFEMTPSEYQKQTSELPVENPQ